MDKINEYLYPDTGEEDDVFHQTQADYMGGKNVVQSPLLNCQKFYDGNDCRYASSRYSMNSGLHTQKYSDFNQQRRARDLYADHVVKPLYY